MSSPDTRSTSREGVIYLQWRTMMTLCGASIPHITLCYIDEIRLLKLKKMAATVLCTILCCLTSTGKCSFLTILTENRPLTSLSIWKFHDSSFRMMSLMLTESKFPNLGYICWRQWIQAYHGSSLSVCKPHQVENLLTFMWLCMNIQSTGKLTSTVVSVLP